MDRQHIEDQHVVAKYLADQLSDADREAFEAYCLEHPEMFREIEATARFKVGLAKLDEARELQPLIEKKPGPMGFVWRHAALIGGVAVGLAVIAAGSYTLRVPAMGATVAEVSGRFGNALPVAAEHELLRKRASGDLDLRITLPKNSAAIHLRVLPDAENAPRYRAELSRETASGPVQIASENELIPGENHFVSLFIRSEKLTQGTYLLKVIPAGEPQPMAESIFRIAVER